MCYNQHIPLFSPYTRICPADTYLLKVNNGNTTMKCGICLKLKTPQRRHCRRFEVVLSSLLLTLNRLQTSGGASIVDFELVNTTWVPTRLIFAP